MLTRKPSCWGTRLTSARQLISLFYLLLSERSRPFTELWLLMCISEPSSPVKLTWQQMWPFTPPPPNTVTPIVVFLTKEFLLENLFSTWLRYISTSDIVVWNSQNYTLFSVQRSASCRFRPREEAKKRPMLTTGDKRKCTINKLRRRRRERWVLTQRGRQSWTHISAAGTATPVHGPKSRKQEYTSQSNYQNSYKPIYLLLLTCTKICKLINNKHPTPLP